MSRLHRLMAPDRIALVGLTDTSPLTPFVAPTLASRADVVFVNPTRPSVLGHPTVPSLGDVDGPIDAVMTLVSARRTVQIAQEMVGLDVGGLIAVASGFAEQGPAGASLQEELRVAATLGGYPVIGPNGLGLINVPKRLSLTIAADHRRRPGGISVVSHSGAVLSGVAMETWRRHRCGLNVLVSAGNEVTTDLADYVDYLAGDPDTRAVGLVIESIRRPTEFFAAVAAATQAGKPVVALKLGRTERSQRLARSHTASHAGNPWIYDTALRQAGVELAYDIEELVDRLVIFDQLDQTRWTRVERLAVITMTGGFASLAGDLAAVEDIGLPALDGFGDWLADTVPGVSVPNPLDATGLGGDRWAEITEAYIRSPEVDAVLMVHPLADEDASHSPPRVDEYARAAADVRKPAVITNCAGAPGAWVTDRATDAVALGNGLRPSLRGLASLGRFVRYRERSVASASGPIDHARPVTDAVSLLTSVGIAIAASPPPGSGFAVSLGWSELGPHVVVDVATASPPQRLGRMAPLSTVDAHDLGDELSATQVVKDVPADVLTILLSRLGELAVSTHDWLDRLSLGSLTWLGEGRGWCASGVHMTIR